MAGYLIKRLVGLVPVLFVVSVVVFALIHLTSGDPARVILGNDASPREVAALKAKLGLNEPLVAQYLHWIRGVATGDLGTSIFLHEPVTKTLLARSQPTAALAVLAQLVALVIALPAGIAAARRPGSVVDRTVMAFTHVGMAIPSFLLGLLLVIFIGVRLTLLPTSGYVPLSDGLWPHLQHLIMPAIALGTIQAALIARMTRTSLLDVLELDYIAFARAKGVRERHLVYHHALRNASLTILTVIGVTFGSLVTGAVVTETIFNVPGIGSILISSINRRDYPVIQGTILMAALLYVLINLLIDIIYSVIDPRIRLEVRGK